MDSTDQHSFFNGIYLIGVGTVRTSAKNQISYFLSWFQIQKKAVSTAMCLTECFISHAAANIRNENAPQFWNLDRSLNKSFTYCVFGNAYSCGPLAQIGRIDNWSVGKRLKTIALDVWT